MTYLDWLKEELMPVYTPPRVLGGHDWPHCERMVQWGPKILGIQGLPEQGPLQFCLHHFAAACWLHNLDRAFRNPAAAEREALRLLRESHFDEPSQETILAAVREHAKPLDESGDDHLLTALRIADKLDRLDDAAFGIVEIGVFLGKGCMLYDPAAPFHYGSTSEESLGSAYQAFMREIEWYGMMPSDDARNLVSPESFGFYVNFVRRFAAAIVRHIGGENRVEDDLRKALGPYYSIFS